jgi:hypothetical protein
MTSQIHGPALCHFSRSRNAHAACSNVDYVCLARLPPSLHLRTPLLANTRKLAPQSRTTTLTGFSATAAINCATAPGSRRYARQQPYSALHAVLDVRQAAAWNARL